MACRYGCERTRWIRRTETCDNANKYASVTVVSGCAHSLPNDGANYYPVPKGTPSTEEAKTARRLYRQAGYVI